ncbi:MAG: hypothetical protein OXB98_01055 [Bryobacterales bacterium]|nr:hypothetical protein [Bryobacterales bacterium]
MRNSIIAVGVVLCLADGCAVPRHDLAEGGAHKAEAPAEEIVEDQPTIAKDYELSQADGGSIRTDLGYNYVLNKNSSLRRVWIAVHDELPLTIDGTPGVTTTWSDRFRYSANVTLLVGQDQDVTAFTMKFVLIDVFGENMATLSAMEIQDIAAGEKKPFHWGWNTERSGHVDKFFASVAFIDKVRTADGQVYQANYDAVLDTVRQFSKEATEADLEPPSDTPRRSGL